MHIVAETVIDVASEYRRRIATLPVEFAFVLYDHHRNTILFTTFFEDIDHAAEDQLAKIEGYMVDSFAEFLLDFRTIHLMGRDIAQFIPAGAIPLLPTRRSELHRSAS